MKKKKTKNPFSKIMIAAGCSLLLIGTLIQLRSAGLQARYDPDTSTYQAATPIPTAISWQEYITHLTPTLLSQGQWPLSKETGHYLLNSATLHQQGNVIIYGHNTDGVLGWLLDVQPTDQLTLTDQLGTTYHYQIESITDVTADDVSWLQPSEQHILTIYTCSGWFDHYRRVVRATLIGSNTLSQSVY
jgi:hypothetical protein